MELFKLFGTIAIEGVKEAQSDINDTADKAEKSESKISAAFKKIGKAIVDAFSKNTEIKNTDKSLSDLTKTITSQEKDLKNLKDKYKDLYLTHGKNSTEAKETAKAIEKLSTELKENKTKLSDAEKAADKFDKALDKTGDGASQVSEKMLGALKKIGAAVVTYFAVDKIKEFGNQLVEASASVSAEVSAFEQIMGGYTEGAQKKLSAVADATGMVDTRLTPYMTSLTAKFKGLGFDIDKATTLASDGLALAADASAFWDKSLEDAMGGLNSFINGSYEGGEAIGLFANDTQLASYAVKTGIVKETKAWSSLDEAKKQATRLQYAKDMMDASGATGQAAKEADQYANVQANLTEKWRQFKAQIGEPLLQNVVLPALERSSQTVDKLSAGYEKLTQWITENKDAIMIAIGVFASAAAAIVGYKTVMLGLSIINTVKGWMNGMTLAQRLLNLAMSANPIGIVIALIAGLVTAFIYFWNTSEGFRNFIISLWETIKNAFNGIVDSISSAWESVKTKTSEVWNSITTFFQTSLDNISKWWNDTWNGISTFFSTKWNEITNFVSVGWETIKNVFTVGIMLIQELIGLAFQIWMIPWNFIWVNFGDVLTEAWNSMVEWISQKLNEIKDFIVNVLTVISEFFKSIWDGIYNFLVAYFTALVNYYTTIFNAIKNVVTTVFNAVSSFVQSVWNSIYAYVANILTTMYNVFVQMFQNIKNVVMTVFNAVKNFITPIWDAIYNHVKNVLTLMYNHIKNVLTLIYNNVKSIFESIKSIATSIFNAVKTTISTIWDAISSKISNVVNNIKNTVSSVFNSVKSTVSNVFNSIKSTATSIWNSIKTAITSPVEQARDKVKGVIDKIKSFFNFSWSLPKLKMPHLSIKGEFSLTPPKVPSFDIEWYKDGGIMTQPTMFGFNPFTNKAMVGGEAGAEAIAPISTLTDYVRAAVREENDGVAYYLQKMIDMISDYMEQVVSKIDRPIVLDDGTLARKLAPQMDRLLGDINKGRGRGR